MVTPDALAEIETIKQLKARYFRHLDTRNWPEWRKVFTDDVAVRVNARVALRNIDVGAGAVELALWGRNINNNRATIFPASLPFVTRASSFQPARTCGIDLQYSF